MPRVCFIIMPFSDTDSCTEQEWTQIFEDVFRPAVENAGLDYECRRSVPTRGNIVASILQDLNDGYLVIADLTDRNANVFYELGVRHALKDRTILLAQSLADVPFDLSVYAAHEYGWRTSEERQDLAERLRQLLTEVDEDPDRPDNPVSDFIQRSPLPPRDLEIPRALPRDAAPAQPLVGAGAEGLDARELVQRLKGSNAPDPARAVLRLTKEELNTLLPGRLNAMAEATYPHSLQRDQIVGVAMSFIEELEPVTAKIEEFALASVEEEWLPGVEAVLRLSGDLISLAARRAHEGDPKFVHGAPSLLAWRMLILSGALAIQGEAFGALQLILNSPIETEESGGRFSHRPLLAHRDLFWPDAFLGYADLGVQYLTECWARQEHLAIFFSSEEAYHFSLAQLMMILSLSGKPAASDHPLYPGYKLIPQGGRAISALSSHLAADNGYLESIAASIGETGPTLVEEWPERAKRANDAALGGRHRSRLTFPETFGGEAEEW